MLSLLMTWRQAFTSHALGTVSQQRAPSAGCHPSIPLRACWYQRPPLYGKFHAHVTIVACSVLLAGIRTKATASDIACDTQACAVRTQEDANEASCLGATLGYNVAIASAKRTWYLQDSPRSWPIHQKLSHTLGESCTWRRSDTATHFLSLHCAEHASMRTTIGSAAGQDGHT